MRQEITNFSFTSLKDKIFEIFKMLKNNIKFTRTACRIDSKLATGKAARLSWYSYIVTNNGNYDAVIIEGI